MCLITSAFLRKVYGILLAQLGLSVVIGVLCMYVTTLKDFLQGRYVYYQHTVEMAVRTYCSVCTVMVVSTSIVYLPAALVCTDANMNVASSLCLLPSNAFVLVVTIFTFISLIMLFVYRYQEPANYFLLAVFVSDENCVFRWFAVYV